MPIKYVIWHFLATRAFLSDIYRCIILWLIPTNVLKNVPPIAIVQNDIRIVGSMRKLKKIVSINLEAIKAKKAITTHFMIKCTKTKTGSIAKLWSTTNISYWLTYSGIDNLPLSIFLSITAEKPPASSVPFIFIKINVPYIIMIWITSVQTTA